MSRTSRSLLAALAASLAVAAPASAAPSPDVVISQVYGGGGNSGATLRNDFIELFNRGGTAVPVDGWSVQYGSSGGSTWNNRTNLSGTIPAGGYYLVRGAAGTGGSQDLPDPDATGSINMSATTGKVALVTDAAELQCGTDCDTAPGVRDFIGYGSANDFETARAPGLSNTTAASRAGAGCTDTDDNSSDFTSGVPAPRNSQTAPAPCDGPPADAAPSVTGSTPANNAADVPLDGTIVVEFSEPVTLTDAFALTCDDSGAHAVAVTGGPTEFTVVPAGTFAGGERCTVTVLAGGVSDQDADDPPDNMAGNATMSFLTLGVEDLSIHDIQGDRHFSGYDDQVVSGVPGVVTARKSNGFYLQETQPDGDEDTSEGILVFTGSMPPRAAAIGNSVVVSGRVDEFRFASGPRDLTITEITSPTVTATGTGKVPATVIGTGGRIPPNRIIDNDTFGDVDLATMFDPREDGLDFHESLEGMLVQINDAVAVGPTNGFGETAVVGDDGRYAGPRTNRGGLIIGPGDFNPERIILDDVISDEPLANVGDTFSEPIVAVVDYSFGNFKYLPIEAPARVDNGLQKEVTEAPRRDQLSVGSFNVENLNPFNAHSKFEALAETLVTNMRAPDLVAVEEIQDNDGVPPPPNQTTSAVTDASETWGALIAAIEEAGGPTYDFREIDPVDDQDGGQPGGNIRVGFLFRTDRGLEFVDRGNGGPTDPTQVVDTRHGARLSLSPGRIEPNDPAWTASRKPLAGEFLWHGRKVFAVANHFASKGGDDPLFGRTQPPVRHTENGPDGRHRQAAVVNEFVQDVLAADRQANVIVMGDINDFEFSETLAILEGDGELFNLMEALPRNERYSYVFDGNSQTLDQILVSKSLMSPKPEYDSVHMNAEFADQTSDHDPQVARLKVVGKPAKD